MPIIIPNDSRLTEGQRVFVYASTDTSRGTVSYRAETLDDQATGQLYAYNNIVCDGDGAGTVLRTFETPEGHRYAEVTTDREQANGSEFPWYEAQRTAMMRRIYAGALGRQGGASTSEAKRAAAAANGRKGGRPRKPSV